MTLQSHKLAESVAHSNDQCTRGTWYLVRLKCLRCVLVPLGNLSTTEHFYQEITCYNSPCRKILKISRRNNTSFTSSQVVASYPFGKRFSCYSCCCLCSSMVGLDYVVTIKKHQIPGDKREFSTVVTMPILSHLLLPCSILPYVAILRPRH